MAGLWKQKTQWFIIESSKQVTLLDTSYSPIGVPQPLLDTTTTLSYIQGQNLEYIVSCYYAQLKCEIVPINTSTNVFLAVITVSNTYYMEASYGNILVQVAFNPNDDINEYNMLSSTITTFALGEDISVNIPYITNYNPSTKIVVTSSANPQNIRYYLLSNQCSKKCVGCLSPNYCTTCDTSKNRVYGRGSSCPCRPGYVEDTYEDCQKCADSNCLVCSSASPNSCLQCLNGYQLNSNLCSCPNGYFYDTPSTSCVQCNFNCSTCTDASSCTACATNNSLVNQADPACSCQDGYFIDLSGQICSKCHSSCKTCSGPYNYQCLTCQVAALGYNGLDATTGLCLCLTGYYRTSEGTCNLCQAPCFTCSDSSTKCISCNDAVTNRYLSSTQQCLCSSGYIEDIVSSNINCKQCTGQKCATCLQTDVTKCNSCPIIQGVQLILNAGSCQCPNGYYDNGTSCSKCHFTCKTCSGTAYNNCLTCNYSLTQTGSICGCPANQYFQNDQCKNCSAICNGGCVNDANSCNGCITNSSMVGTAPGICSCNEQYYFNGTTCQQCTGPCSRCTSTSVCTECMPNATLSGGVCSCVGGYYLDASLTKCDACPTHCLTCVNNTGCTAYICDPTCATCSGPNSTDCLSCNPLQNRKLAGSQCNCVSSNYSIQNSVCMLCHSSCSACSGPFGNQCTTCTDPKIIVSPNGYCSDCEDGYFMLNNVCTACNSGCIKCENQASNCIKCSGMLVLQTDNTCKCNSDHTLRALTTDQCDLNTCTAANNCLTCLGDHTTCLTCDATLNRYLVGTQCLCKSGYAQDVGTGLCVTCHYPCLTCASTDPTQCTSCNPDNFRILETNQCQCLDGYYDDTTNQLCQKCRYNCAKCTNSTSCTTCIGTDRSLGNDCKCSAVNYTDYGFLNACVKCPTGYYSLPTDTSKCLECDKNCQDCQLTSTQCTSCNPLSQRTLDASNICQCQTAQYPLDVNGIKCQECPYYCPSNCQIEASTPLATKYTSVCKSCDAASNRIASPSDVYLCICADGYYDQVGLLACQHCHYSCLTCIGPGIDQCSTCPATRDLVNSLTTTSVICKCKTQYYDNPITTVCEQCNKSCAECLSLSYCTACIDPLMILNNGQCSCPNGYFLSLGTGTGGLNQCVKCNYTCGTCLNSNAANNCLTCAHYSRTFEYNIGTDKTGQCVCGANLFEAQPPNEIECVQCHYSCLTCSGGSADTNCVTCDSSMNRISDGAGKCPCIPLYQAVAGVALCTNCDFSCNGCTGPNNDMCTSCDATRQAVTSANGFTCPCLDGYYEGNLPQCQKCHYSCSKCDGGNNYNCLDCPAGTNRLTTQLPLCPCQNYFYDDGKNANCVACSHRCAQCSKGFSSICLSCLASDFRVYNELKQDCVCMNGYYDNGVSQCAQCDAQCVTCEDGLGHCLTCDPYKFRVLSSNKCPCKPGYSSTDLTNLAVCTPCLSKCATCDPVTGYCTSCSGTHRDTITPGVTACDCMPGYVDVSGVCQQCDYTCPSQCTGPLKTQCNNLCQSIGNAFPLFRTYNAVTGTCDCSTGYSENINIPSSSVCILCHASCLTCFQTTQYSCLTCDANLFRYYSATTSQCLCMPGYYQDPTTKLCLLCTAPCKTCSVTATSCTSCSDTNNRVLNTGTNQCDCKRGFYDNGGVCSQCNYSCSSCSDGTLTGCLLCDFNKGRYKVNGSTIIAGMCSCQNGFYDDLTNELCLSCHWSCSTCSGTGIDCATCDSTREIKPVMNGGGTYDNLCQCKQTYYSQYPNLQCFKCHYSCQYCSGPGQYDCTSCDTTQQRQQGAFNNNGITFQCTCQTGFFDVAGQQQCSTCPYHCQTCSRDAYNEECLTCDPVSNRQFDVISGRCACKPGFYEDPAVHQMVCQPCHASCAECSAGTYQDCTKCNSLSFRSFQNGQCVCQVGYFNANLSSAACQPCYYACKTCSDITGSTNNACLSCDADKFRTQVGGYCNCQAGYMDVSPIPTCQQCNYSCGSCDNTLPIITNQCKTCNSLHNRYLLNSNCPCLDGFYEIAGNPICQPCDPSCKTCNGSSNSQCLTCEPLNNRVQNGAQCPCVVGFYSSDSTNKKCDSCHYKCLTCNGPLSNQCTSCDSAQNRVLISNQCQCQPNLFDIIDVKLCSSCHYSCLGCTSNTAISCTSCPIGSNRTLTNNQCKCNDGYYDVSLNQICQPCNFSCQSCNAATPTQCLTCNAKNYRVLSGTLCNCMPGYFESNQPACVQCDITCLSCDGPGPSSCTSCDANAFRELMPDKTCRCISGYFFNSATQSCLPCNSNCKECYDTATRCISCDISQILQPITNICVCADRFYNNNSVCSKCDSSCLQCSGASAAQCTQCSASDNRILAGNVCNCTAGFYSIIGKGQCAPCHFSCTNCSGPDFNNCSGCSSSNFRTFNVNQCPCSPGYFDPSTQICQKCHYSCKTCDQKGEFDCLDCPASVHRQYIAANKQCSCVDGFYNDTVSQSCLPCHFSCLTCSGPNASNCLTCSLPLHNRQYNDQTGLCTCISGTYTVPNQARCAPCHYSCQECSPSPASTSCTKCSDANYRAYNSAFGRCDCNDGYFDDSHSPQCALCHYSCKKCIRGDANSCTDCDSLNFFRQFNTTTQTCDCKTGYYSEIGVQKCQPCHFTCNTCNGPAENNCLSCQMAAKRYITSGNMCSCQVGYYDVPSPDNPAIRICSPCKETCYSCSSYSTCTGCRNSDNRQINSVTQTCDCKDGFYQIISGTVTLAACQSCSVADNKIVSQDKLSCICKPGYYMNSIQKCIACPVSCTECESFSNCTVCDGANFRLLNSGACIPMVGYFESGLQIAAKCNSLCKGCTITDTNCTSCRTDDGYIMTDDQKSCKCRDNYSEIEDLDTGIKVCRTTQSLVQQSSNDNNVMWFYIFLSISAILAMIIIIYVARRTCFKQAPTGSQRIHVLDQTNNDIFNQKHDSNIMLDDQNNNSRQQIPQQLDDYGLSQQQKNKLNAVPSLDRIKEQNL